MSYIGEMRGLERKLKETTDEKGTRGNRTRNKVFGIAYQNGR